MAYATMRDGARLYYRDVGRGPVCVLLHSFGMPGQLWLPLVAPLRLRWRFIIPDLRGFGASHGLPIGRAEVLHQYADDLEDLLTALQLDGCALAGMSMGACTALEYQRRYGFGRIRAYLNIDNPPCVTTKPGWPWGLTNTPAEPLIAQMREVAAELEACGRMQPFHALPLQSRRRMWGFLATFAQASFSNGFLRRVAGLARFEKLVSLIQPTHNWPVYIDTMRIYCDGDRDWRDSVARTGGKPFWVFAGTHSRIYPLEGQLQFEQLVPAVRMVRFENCGHTLVFDAPLRFIREFDRFLSETRLAETGCQPMQQAA